MRFWILLMSSLLVSSAAEPVFVDTDCGDFGDDGAALVMLARSPKEVTIVGAAGVSGNVWAAEAAGFARRALEAAGLRGVPIASGAVDPLVRTAAMSDEARKRWGDNGYHGAFDRQPVRDRDGLRGVQLLIEAIDRQPGKVTVLALGPMTNVSIALRLRPDLEEKIGRLVFMGGNVHVKGNISDAAEFNFWFDPEAAAVVLRSAIREKVMFALDITNKAPLTRALFDQVVAVQTPVTALYREDFGTRYPGFLRDPKAASYLWDELAAAWLIDPKFVTREESLHLDVETVFGKQYGAVIPLDRRLAPRATPVRVMLDLNLDRLTALYLDKLRAH